MKNRRKKYCFADPTIGKVSRTRRSYFSGLETMTHFSDNANHSSPNHLKKKKKNHLHSILPCCFYCYRPDIPLSCPHRSLFSTHHSGQRYNHAHIFFLLCFFHSWIKCRAFTWIECRSQSHSASEHSSSSGSWRTARIWTMEEGAYSVLWLNFVWISINITISAPRTPMFMVCVYDCMSNNYYYVSISSIVYYYTT